MSSRSQRRHAAARSFRTRLAVIVAAVLSLTALVAVPSVASASSTVGIFADDLKPSRSATHSRSAVELGVAFTPRSDGTVTALQYYQGRSASGVTQATLWSEGGTVLARATFDASRTVGWRTVSLTAPVALKAGETYTASYYAPQGRYPVTKRDLTSFRTQNGFALSRGAGVYRHGESGFPQRSARGSNFLVDIVYRPTSKPVVTSKPAATPKPKATSQPIAPPKPTSTSAPKPTATPTVTAAPKPTATTAPAPKPTATPSPTATPKPTPAPTAPPTVGAQLNCITVPSACGYPDETNTGVSPGAVLINVPQDATSGPGWTYRSDIRAIQTTGDNATIQNVRLVGGLILVQHKGVTVRDVYLESGGYYPIDCDYAGATRAAHSCLGLTVENTEIAGQGADCAVGLAFNGYTARRVYVHGCQDGFRADSDVLIEDSYVTALAYSPESRPGAGDESHNDGLQTTASGNVTVRHTTFKLGNQSNVNSVFQVGVQGRTGKGLTIESNLIDGGAWMINDSNSPVQGVLVKDNRFTHRAAYGIGYIAGGSWVGNRWDDTFTLIPANG